MRLKSIAAIAMSTALIMGGTAAVAGAQESTSSNASSEIPLPKEITNFLDAFLPAAQAEQIEGALQSSAGFVALNLGSTAIGSTVIGSSALNLVTSS